MDILKICRYAMTSLDFYSCEDQWKLLNWLISSKWWCCLFVEIQISWYYMLKLTSTPREAGSKMDFSPKNLSSQLIL